MNPKKILVITLLVILLCSLLIGGVAARYTTPEGMDAGISPGNTIYIGESNLNFSALGTAGKTITGLVRFDGDTPQNKIAITNDIGSVPGNTVTGYYCVEYNNAPQKGTPSV